MIIDSVKILTVIAKDFIPPIQIGMKYLSANEFIRISMELVPVFIRK